MIKRTLYFGNPAYLSLKLKQLVIRLPHTDGEKKDERSRTGASVRVILESVSRDSAA